MPIELKDQQDDSKPVVQVNTTVLESKGFTVSGTKQFEETIIDYSQQLLKRSTHLGYADKASGMEAEITHEHVKASAHTMAKAFGAPAKSGWLVAGNVGEYLATAIAGVGGGHLDQSWGIATFGISVSIAILLVVVRLTFGKGD